MFRRTVVCRRCGDDCYRGIDEDGNVFYVCYAHKKPLINN